MSSLVYLVISVAHSYLIYHHLLHIPKSVDERAQRCCTDNPIEYYLIGFELGFQTLFISVFMSILMVNAINKIYCPFYYYYFMLIIYIIIRSSLLNSLSSPLHFLSIVTCLLEEAFRNIFFLMRAPLLSHKRCYMNTLITLHLHTSVVKVFCICLLLLLNTLVSGTKVLD